MAQFRPTGERVGLGATDSPIINRMPPRTLAVSLPWHTGVCDVMPAPATALLFLP